MKREKQRVERAVAAKATRRETEAEREGDGEREKVWLWPMVMRPSLFEFFSLHMYSLFRLNLFPSLSLSLSYSLSLSLSSQSVIHFHSKWPCFVCLGSRLFSCYWHVYPLPLARKDKMVNRLTLR